MKKLFGGNRVCGVAAAATAREMRALLRATRGQTTTIEVRLDYLRSKAERDSFLAWLARQRLRATFVATCRSLRGGGRFHGSRPAQLEILARAAVAGCHWCDVEIETAEHYSAEELREALSPGACWH